LGRARDFLVSKTNYHLLQSLDYKHYIWAKEVFFVHKLPPSKLLLPPTCNLTMPRTVITQKERM